MRRRAGLVSWIVAGVLLTGCSGSPAGPVAAGSDRTPAPTSSGVPSMTSPPATTAPPAVPPPSPTPTRRRTLKPGAKGDDVRALQARLRMLAYDPGKIDGRYGPALQSAVWAFQKVNGLKVSARLGARFWAALDAPKDPRPVARKRERTRVDVNLTDQYLVVYKRGEVALISHISSGSGEYYCAKDFGSDTPRCRYAGTPTGDFVTGRRASGWERSPLGQLYNPIYFNGGIAFHGAPYVPAYPDSHGCVRIPMHSADEFPELVGDKVPVHVRRPKRSRS